MNWRDPPWLAEAHVVYGLRMFLADAPIGSWEVPVSKVSKPGTSGPATS